MDDLLGKAGKLLSDPESVRQLQELAQLLQSEENSADTGASAQNDTAGEEFSGDGLDMSMLLRLQELMGVLQQNDEDAALLLALRPHLKHPRQKKLDQAVKLLKLYAIFSTLKENGMLQDFLS